MIRHRRRRSSSLLAASAGAALAIVHGSGAGAQTVETTVPQVVTAPAAPAVAVRNVTTFVDLGWTYERNSRTNGIVGNLSKERTWQATAGIEVAVTPWLALGGGLTFLDGEGSSGRGFRRYSTDGITGFLTGTVTLPELFTLQVSGGYGRQDTDQTLLVAGSAAPSDYASWSRFASATISRTFYAQDLAIRPFAQLLYAETENGSYLAAPNLLNRASADTLGRTAAGLEFSYPILVSDVLIAPVASAALMYDFNLPNEYRDRTAVDVQAGLNVFRGRLTGGLRYSAVVGRTDYIQHGARFFLAYQF